MKKLTLIIAMLVAPIAFADSQEVTASGDTITAKHRYTMGDNDSKADAVNLCFLQAKRKAIEYAGVYVESSTEISQTNTSSSAKSNMKSLARALVSTELASNTTGFENGRMFVDCVVNAKIDMSTVKQDVQKIASDPAAKKQIEQQQIALKKLEDEIAKIQTQLKTASSQQAVSLRQERTVVFQDIDELQQKKLKIMTRIADTKNLALKAEKLIERYMTKAEVITLLGKPSSVGGKGEVYKMNYKTVLNYGTGSVYIDEHGAFFYCDEARPASLIYDVYDTYCKILDW